MTVLGEFGWKVLEVGDTDVRMHGVLFVLIILALFFHGWK